MNDVEILTHEELAQQNQPSGAQATTKAIFRVLRDVRLLAHKSFRNKLENEALQEKLRYLRMQDPLVVRSCTAVLNAAIKINTLKKKGKIK